MADYLPRLIAGLLMAGSIGMVIAVRQSPGVEPPGSDATRVESPQAESQQVASDRVQPADALDRRVALGDQSPLAAPGASVPAAPQHGTIGVAGCAAANCHGGNRHREGLHFSAYEIWIQQDRHAQAYETLLGPRSQQIARRLQLPVPAHAAQECLSCHSLVADTSRLDARQRHQLVDGVSCEACHGPAQNWVEPHTSAAWRNPAIWSEARKAATGFRATKDLLTRTRVCVECHVGSEGRDVNHDLLAAGHPRMDFELGAFHANMPRHWDRKKDKARNAPSLEARLWAIGQVVSAEASVKLLHARAVDHKAPWPEFSEYGCFACHHNLQSPSARQEREVAGRNRSDLEWGGWYFALLPRTVPVLSPEHAGPVDESLRNLKSQMQQRRPGRDEAQASATALSTALQDLVQSIASDPLDREKLHQLLLTLSSGPPSRPQTVQTPQYQYDWEVAAQLYLALVAVRQGYVESQGRKAGDPLIAPLTGIRDQLRFPAGHDSPPQFLPDRSGAIQAEIDWIHRIIEQE